MRNVTDLSHVNAVHKSLTSLLSLASLVLHHLLPGYSTSYHLLPGYSTSSSERSTSRRGCSVGGNKSLHVIDTVLSNHFYFTDQVSLHWPLFGPSNSYPFVSPFQDNTVATVIAAGRWTPSLDSFFNNVWWDVSVRRLLVWQQTAVDEVCCMRTNSVFVRNGAHSQEVCRYPGSQCKPGIIGQVGR